VIVNRQTFYAKFGQGDALVALIRELIASPEGKSMGIAANHVYTDVTGSMFTVIWDEEHANIEAYADAQKKLEAFFGTETFRKFFARMTDLVERGERSLLTKVV